MARRMYTIEQVAKVAGVAIGAVRMQLARGTFAEAKESLAGYLIVDVEDEARALEIASRIVAVIEGPVEVRQVMDAPPEEYTS